MGGSKWNWLLEHLIEFTSSGSVLIFVTKKANCEELAHNLKAKEFEVGLLHGDLNQVSDFFSKFQSHYCFIGKNLHKFGLI